MLYKIYLILGISLICFTSKAQNAPLIQFSGYVMSSDSMEKLSYTQVYNKSKNTGLYTNLDGYFSIIASPGDSISFYVVGYRKNWYVMPKEETRTKLTGIQFLSRDTIQLNEVIILPWKTTQELRQAFVELRLNDDDLARAQKNLNPALLAKVARNTEADGREIATLYLRQQATKYYNPTYGSASQAAQSTFLNPLAWLKFIQAWKNGDFSNKNKD